MIFVLAKLFKTCKQLCNMFLKRVAANEQVLPMVGKMKTVRLATEVHDFVQRLIINSNVQKSSFRPNQS